MYLPSHFAESRSEVMHALMQAHPFATLVTQGGMGLSADHLPLHLAAAIGPFGALQGHVARANPLWRNAADSEVLAIFQGPQAYVTPSWYETKRADGKAVLDAIRNDKQISDDTKAKLKAEIDKFAKSFA